MSIIISLLISILLTACHTTERWFNSEFSEQVSPSNKKIDDNDLLEIKPKVISLQLQYGVFPPKDRMYSETHNIHCFQDGALKACYLRLVLTSSPYLTEPMQLSRRLSEKVLDIIQNQRAELKPERQIFASLVCDHMKNTLPPFQKNMEFCRLMRPRKINEHVMQESVAKALTKIIDRTAKNPAQLPEYVVECDAEETFSCKISKATGLKSRAAQSWVVIPDKISGTLSKDFARDYLNHWTVLNGRKKADIPRAGQLNGIMSCSSLANMVKSLYLCTIKF